MGDVVASSQTIVLVTDGPVVELDEVRQTYADTWGRVVRCLEMRKYEGGGNTLLAVTPDLETPPEAVGTSEAVEGGAAEDNTPEYSEAYHLEGVSQVVADIYDRVKAIAGGIDDAVTFDPQEHYISIKDGKKELASIAVRNKKLRFIAVMPESDIRRCVTHHPIAVLSAARGFYKGPCVAVDIEALDHMDEIESLMRLLIGLGRPA